MYYVCMKTYAESDGPLILAHRGGAGEAPENSLEAFWHAVNLGITHLETDVRLGNNGVLYLHHSATSLLPNRLLKPSDEDVPLSQLFNAFPAAFFAIDPKHDHAIEPLAEIIASRGMQNQVCIGASFDRRTKQVADRIEELSGTRPYTAMVSAAASAALLTNTIRPESLRATYVHVHTKLINQRTVDVAHKKGLKVIAWVLNESSQIHTMLAMGIDGFMTDYPSMALDIVRKR